MISKFYIRAQLSRTTQSSLTKIRKQYFLDATISQATFFLFFIITFCIGFTRTENKYVKVIDYDICNRKMEFNAKSEIMKRNRNYKVVDKKIWRVLKCKEIVTPRDFLYKFWFVQFGFLYNVVRRRINVETTSCVYRVMFQFGLVPTISNTTRVTNKARNATRCNNRNDLLHLNFTLKVSIFSEAYI